MMNTSTLDTPTKRRSLPPLNLDDDSAKKVAGTARKTRKKKPTDLTDPRTSAGDDAVMSEELRGAEGIDSDVRKAKKKKRQSYPSVDQADELDDDSTRYTDKRAKSPVSGRKKRMPRSVSEEVLQEGAQANNGSLAIKNKKGRPKSPRDNFDVDGNPVKQSQRPTTGKGKRKKKSRPLLSGDENYHADVETQSVDLMVSKEDILSEETRVEPHIENNVLPSQPVGKIFMERKSDFTSEDKARLAKRREQELRALGNLPQDTRVTTTQAALVTHRTFLTTCLFCHGLLAGYALWHCVVVFVLAAKLPNSDKSGTDQFLEQYSRLALPSSSVFYLLIAVCTVSVFDRFDIGRPNRQFFRGLVTFQSGAVSTLVYFVCLVLSISITAIDDRISLYLKTEMPYCDGCQESDSLWQDADSERRLTTWKVIMVIRAAGVIIGWVIITITPQTDYTSEHLHDADEPLWEEQHMSEITDAGDLNI